MESESFWVYPSEYLCWAYRESLMLLRKVNLNLIIFLILTQIILLRNNRWIIILYCPIYIKSTNLLLYSSYYSTKTEKSNFQPNETRAIRSKYCFLTCCNVDSRDRMFPSFPLDHCFIFLSIIYIVYRDIY